MRYLVGICLIFFSISANPNVWAEDVSVTLEHIVGGCNAHCTCCGNPNIFYYCLGQGSAACIDDETSYSIYLYDFLNSKWNALVGWGVCSGCSKSPSFMINNSIFHGPGTDAEKFITMDVTDFLKVRNNILVAIPKTCEYHSPTLTTLLAWPGLKIKYEVPGDSSASVEQVLFNKRSIDAHDSNNIEEVVFIVSRLGRYSISTNSGEYSLNLENWFQLYEFPTNNSNLSIESITIPVVTVTSFGAQIHQHEISVGGLQYADIGGGSSISDTCPTMGGLNFHLFTNSGIHYIKRRPKIIAIPTTLAELGPVNGNTIFTECGVTAGYSTTIELCNINPLEFSKLEVWFDFNTNSLQATPVIPNSALDDEAPKYKIPGGQCRTFQVSWNGSDIEALDENNNFIMTVYSNDDLHPAVQSFIHIEGPLVNKDIDVINPETGETHVFAVNYGRVQTNLRYYKYVKLKNIDCRPHTAYFVFRNDARHFYLNAVSLADFTGLSPGQQAYSVLLDPMEEKILTVGFLADLAGYYFTNVDVYMDTLTGDPRHTIQLMAEATDSGLEYFSFSLSSNPMITMECTEEKCHGSLNFQIVPALSNLTSPDCSDIDINTVKDNLAFRFDPCGYTYDVLFPTLSPPPGYSGVVQVSNTDTACGMGGVPACLVTSELKELQWRDASRCIIEGTIEFVAFGADNVARCRNVPEISNFEENPSGLPVSFSSSVTPYYQAADIAFNEVPGTTVFTIRFPSDSESSENIARTDRDLEGLQLKIVVSDYETNATTFRTRIEIEGFFVNEVGMTDILPSNAEITNIQWVGPEISGTEFEDMRVIVIDAPNTGTANVTLRVDVKYDLGSNGIRNVTYWSNKLVFFAPIDCPGGQTYCLERPPYIKPQGAPNYPVFTARIVEQDDQLKPVYDSHQGIPCTGCQPLTYVLNNYWKNIGVAENGVWYDWFPIIDASKVAGTPESSPLGYREFEFPAVRPWMVYVLCNLSQYQLPTDGGASPYHPAQTITDYMYNSHALYDNLMCPTSGNPMHPDWQLVWSSVGWVCVEYMCIETIIPNAGPIRGVNCM